MYVYKLSYYRTWIYWIFSIVLVWVKVSGASSVPVVITLRTKRTSLYGRPSQPAARGPSVAATQCFVGRREIWYEKASFNLFPGISEIHHPSILKKSEVCLSRHMTLLTFQSLVVSLRTTRFTIKKFYIVLALHWAFCTDLNRQRLLLCTSLTDWFL